MSKEDDTKAPGCAATAADPVCDQCVPCLRKRLRRQADLIKKLLGAAGETVRPGC